MHSKLTKFNNDSVLSKLNIMIMSDGEVGDVISYVIGAKIKKHRGDNRYLVEFKFMYRDETEGKMLSNLVLLKDGLYHTDHLNHTKQGDITFTKHQLTPSTYGESYVESERMHELKNKPFNRKASED